MTIRGDMETMLHGTPEQNAQTIRDLFDWMGSADVLAFLDRATGDGDAENLVWAERISLLREKCATVARPAEPEEHNSDIVHRGSKCAVDTGTVYPCIQCGKHHLPMTPCKDPRLPGSAQSTTHGIQAVTRWAKTVSPVRPIKTAEAREIERHARPADGSMSEAEGNYYR
jgi:hypothetical protein